MTERPTADHNWYEDDELLALDEQIDPPLEDWEIDLIDSHLVARGEFPARPRVVGLEQLSYEEWVRFEYKSRDRLKRLHDVGSPAIIIANEERLWYRALAGVCWHRSEMLRRALEPDD